MVSIRPDPSSARYNQGKTVDIRRPDVTADCVRAPAFEVACARNDIDHRLTKHPWTNGQAERMRRTIKDATVKRDETHDELRAHLTDFVTAYDFPKRLKTFNGLTPYEYICKALAKEPERFLSIRSPKCRD